jgi:N-methylhydantoinase B
VAAVNDPFRGGTHLPDITLVSQVHSDVPGGVLGYLAVRAHHADVGGMAPGSMPLAREIYQEGLRIPPVLLVAERRREEGVWRLLLANVRTPEEREGDLAAQLAALAVGGRRLKELAARRGAGELAEAMTALTAYADRLVRAGLARIPAGEYRAAGRAGRRRLRHGPLPDGNAAGGGRRRWRSISTGTAGQTEGGVNAVAAITVSCVRYVTRCVVEALLGQPLPAGGGEMEAVRVILPERSLVNAGLPASVAAGNVETSQRIADVLLLAFARRCRSWCRRSRRAR